MAIVGFGKIAEFIVTSYLAPTLEGERMRSQFEIVAVWNRTSSKLADHPIIEPRWILADLAELAERSPDLIVEVSHPDVLIAYGVFFLTIGDLFVGSPTGFADDVFFSTMTAAAVDPKVRGSILLPAGALWGSTDISKMGERKLLASASITMKKPAHSMKLEEPLSSMLHRYVEDVDAQGECVLYEGPVRQLCSLAPNNVNTMACFAIATQLGFDAVVGKLVADKALSAHVIIAEVVGKHAAGREDQFRVKSERYNPCNPNEVTGIQTYVSFLSSLQRCANLQIKGTHFV